MKERLALVLTIGIVACSLASLCYVGHVLWSASWVGCLFVCVTIATFIVFSVIRHNVEDVVVELIDNAEKEAESDK